MTIRDQIKQIAKEVIQGGAGPSKYRLATVVGLNPDGSCNVILDGNTVEATPIFPVVQGQQVAVVKDDNGSVSAIPTRPSADQVSTIHPPFFTGGKIILSWVESAAGFKWAIRFQVVGNPKIYRWLIQNPPNQADFSSMTIPTAFSPNGQYFAYAFSGMLWQTQSQGPAPVADTTKIAVVKLGASPKAGSAIPNTTQGFFLDASETTVVTPKGFDLVLKQFPPQFADDQVLVEYRINSLFVTNSGQLYWTEFFFIQDLDPVNPSPPPTFTHSPFVFHTAAMILLCTADTSGNRTVVASLQDFDAFQTEVGSGVTAVDTVVLQGTSIGGVLGDTSRIAGPQPNYSVSLGSFIFDVSNGMTLAFKVKGFPAGTYINTNLGINPATQYCIADVFQLNQNYGFVAPVIDQEYDDGTIVLGGQPPAQQPGPPTFSRNNSAIVYTNLINNNADLRCNVLYQAKGKTSIQRYTVLNVTANLFLGIPFIFFGGNDTQRGIVVIDPGNTNAAIVKKVKTDGNALTVTPLTGPASSSQYKVSPQNPDTGFTDFNPRTATFDSYTPLTIEPQAVGLT